MATIDRLDIFSYYQKESRIVLIEQIYKMLNYPYTMSIIQEHYEQKHTDHRSMTLFKLVSWITFTKIRFMYSTTKKKFGGTDGYLEYYNSLITD